MPQPLLLLRVLVTATLLAGWRQAAGQLPPARGPLPGSGPGLAGGQSAALQDAVEGIAGLMQRFEQLQPQMAALPPAELEEIARPAQLLHERFQTMQGRMLSNGGSAGPQLEQEAITFHKDLALFVDQVSARLGVTGPRHAGTGPAQVSLGSLPQMAASPQPGAGSTASPATERRLQAAMQAIQSNMQKFQTLHPKLQSLPQQVFTPLANQAQQLHEEFLRLQKRGIELAGDGNRQMLEADAAPYADQLDSYVSRQTAFVADAQSQVSKSAGMGGGSLGSLGYNGMLGDRIHTTGTLGGAKGAAGSGLGSQAFGSPPQVSMPPLQPGALGGSMPAQSIPGQVTPATDARLSAVIDKVVKMMQEFQGIAPQLARAAPGAVAQLASTGTTLDTRFRELQQRGAAIAGDGTRPMTEKEASAYLLDMEAFHEDQARYVAAAQEAIQSSGGSGTRPGMPGSSGLGSASLEDLRGGGSLGSGLSGGNLGVGQAGGNLGSGLGGGRLGGGLAGGSFGSGLAGGRLGSGLAGGNLDAGLAGGSFGSGLSGGSLGSGLAGGSLGSGLAGGSLGSGLAAGSLGSGLAGGSLGGGLAGGSLGSGLNGGFGTSQFGGAPPHGTKSRPMFGASKASKPAGDEAGLEALEKMGSVKLDTSVLGGSEVCADGTCSESRPWQ